MPKLDDNLQELESLTTRLSSVVRFDEALELYKKGLDLAAACSKQLDTIQQKVTVLSEENGKIMEKVLTNDD
jgi:exodeoxyribonuclease VII small subunit